VRFISFRRWSSAELPARLVVQAVIARRQFLGRPSLQRAMSEVSEKRSSSGAAGSLDALFRSQVHSAEISAALRAAAVAQRCRSNLEWSRSTAFQAQLGD
jgi:hypothetical protein